MGKGKEAATDPTVSKAVIEIYFPFNINGAYKLPEWVVPENPCQLTK